VKPEWRKKYAHIKNSRSNELIHKEI